jgi:hypothetical protein
MELPGCVAPLLRASSNETHSLPDRRTAEDVARGTDGCQRAEIDSPPQDYEPLEAILVLLSPAAAQAARESARRSSCQNTLKQWGLAMHNLVDAKKKFPLAITNSPRTTWVPFTWAHHFGTRRRTLQFSQHEKTSPTACRTLPKS